MQRDFIPRGRSLGGSSDLTLLAPIKPGLVESLESLSYKTRIKRVLELLHGARTHAHEFHLARLLSDSIERVGAIQSVRVAVLEPENKVLLSVSFDGPWDAYVRVLWDKVGTLLDLIFCGTQDYVLASGGRFEAWREWAQRVQIETSFFYGPPDATARDVLYHRRVERMAQRGADDAVNHLRATQPGAESWLDGFLDGRLPQVPDEPALKLPRNASVKLQFELTKGGLRGLAALYRLTDLHRPGTPDGEVLRRASIDLLREFVRLWEGGQIKEVIDEMRATRFARQIDWLFPDGRAALLLPRRPDDAALQPLPLIPAVLADVQVGIVRAHGPLSHGAMLLLAFGDAQAAAGFLRWLEAHVTIAASARPATPAAPHCSVSFTPLGLRACGLDEDTIELFPEDFRQGMAARAGLLGDVRLNHPFRWRLPRPGVDAAPPAGGPEPAGHLRVALDAVHAVLQLRCLAPADTEVDVPLNDPGHPLYAYIAQMEADHPGLRCLSSQPLVRREHPHRVNTSQEHFGYADGMGQPEIEPSGTGNDDNRVHLGEVLVGHDNAADFAPDPGDPVVPERERQRLLWLANGSFLVVRKMRQFAWRLEAAVRETAQQVADAFGGTAEDHIETVYARLMGRDRDGQALIPNALGNDFDYRDDPTGERCPLHAHMRLAHPRLPIGSMARPPRLVRRGMSYGPAHRPGTDDDNVERGVVFIAYNASLSEQFEVVQRWLTGGNATGKSSGHVCPIVGVPENGLARHFRFELTRPGTKQVPTVFTLTLAPSQPMFEEADSPTRLEWGLYLFAPSLTTIGRLAGVAEAAAASPGTQPVPWQVARGREILAQLQGVQAAEGPAAALQAWKLAIEDPEAIDRLDSAALWAAVREDHGGVLRTPYGVLVAGREWLHQVLHDPQRQYSIGGQRKRMQDSFGDIYLGMDPGQQYETESREVNLAIGTLAATAQARTATFELARDRAWTRFDAILEQAATQADDVHDAGYETTVDARELIDEVLAGLCEDWFGLQGSPHLAPGSTDWAWQDDTAALYPGHFTALSRNMFQPHPGPMATELSRRYGVGLSRGMGRFVADRRAADAVPVRADGSEAPIGAAIFRHPTLGSDDAWVTRTMVGVMMGFIAPLLGSLLNVLREWHRDGSFWKLRAQLGGRTDRASAEAVLLQPLMAALRMRPMPPLVWRTALASHRLGPPGPHAVDVQVGDVLVLGLVSGTQQSLADGQSDGRLMFGGAREGAGHPTHACPGYGTAVDALLGALTALLARPEMLHPGAGPLTWRVEGPVPGALEEMFAATFDVQPQEPDLKDLPARQTGRDGLVLAVGDSWVQGPYRTDLVLQLRSFSWTVDSALCSWFSFGTASQLQTKLADIRVKLSKAVKANAGKLPLRGVLLSAGGNDSTKGAFKALLDPNDHDLKTPAINPDRLATHVGALRQRYEVIVTGIKQELDLAGVQVPIYVHGYDFTALPPGKSGWKVWFDGPFVELGYDETSSRRDRLRALHDLIFAFDEQMALLAADPRFSAYVRHVPLNGTIAEYWSDTKPLWEDDLHPKEVGFFVLACKIDAALMQPYP